MQPLKVTSQDYHRTLLEASMRDSTCVMTSVYNGHKLTVLWKLSHFNCWAINMLGTNTTAYADILSFHFFKCVIECFVLLKVATVFV